MRDIHLWIEASIMELEINISLKQFRNWCLKKCFGILYIQEGQWEQD